MEDIKDLGSLLLHHLQNLYSAEEQMMRTMPLLIEKANHPSLQNALKHHLSLTEEQQKRLEQVTKLLQEKINSTGKKGSQQVNFTAELKKEYTCKGMAGLIEEANELLERNLAQEVVDAALITCVQKMEHYEISTYGTALAYAEQLHLPKAAALLEETLDEEYDADDLLTALATSALNKEAEPEGIHDDQKDLPEAESARIKAAKNTEHITERNINSPGGRAGTSHRRYPSGESRGH
jgi:ferritin-like metal-binding protein YciE